MKLDKLFQVLVVGGAMLGAVASCGRPDGKDSPGETQGSGSGGTTVTGTDGGTPGGDADGGTTDSCGGVCCWLGGY